jgi:arginine-tRNA-protein transferase
VGRNSTLHRQSNSPWATEAQYDLFKTYLDTRHADGGMVDMDVFEFAAMIEETPVNSQVIEYSTEAGALEAVCLTDIFDDGVSLVYSFFNTEFSKKSLGIYIILDHIKIAQQSGLPYVYLGYWVPGSKKMAYKAKFKGVEIFHNKNWTPLDQNEGYAANASFTDFTSLSAQVAEISMPNMTHIRER